MPSPPGPQSAPDVSVGGDGSFVVVWQGYGEGSDYSDVFARRFASNGTPQGDEFQVNAPVAAGSSDGAAAVAATASGSSSSGTTTRTSSRAASTPPARRSAIPFR